MAELAARLRIAEADRTPVEPLTSDVPELTVADAYRIQQLNVRARVNDGDPIRGRKIGLTSEAMQRQLGVDEPDFGALFASMIVEEGDEVQTAELIHPRAEAEIGFVMAEELKGPGVTAIDALRAVAGALPTIEVIDSRVTDWKIAIQDTIADNASAARVICGARLTPLADVDLRLTGMVLRHNGTVVATGAGAAVLGNPIRCVAWLANKLGEFGVGLRAGDLVLAGALTAAVAVAAGDTLTADFADLGSVTTRFATEENVHKPLEEE
ncbi:2-keto-4-pentenoate hydratase [Amycolatopsis pithecellobii]|uniref:2-keto-4-pentenoate hydratase n=1 Tax=Amycolatopsis pithecellobii TaxID=664692 RepID=UPI001FE537A5|nr:fumarylacetoacetate hydrolase family protein [Amycolatopsis pithecellobii]